MSASGPAGGPGGGGAVRRSGDRAGGPPGGGFQCIGSIAPGLSASAAARRVSDISCVGQQCAGVNTCSMGGFSASAAVRRGQTDVHDQLCAGFQTYHAHRQQCAGV